MRKISVWLMSMVSIVMIISTASALPEILDVFNRNYNTIGTKLDSCDICHISGKPKISKFEEVYHIPGKPARENNSLNSYGMNVKDNLNIEIDKALTKIEGLDSDGDKFTNIDEIRNLTFPGEKKDFPKKKRSKVNPNIMNIELFGIFNFSVP